MFSKVEQPGKPAYRFDLITVPGYEFFDTIDNIDVEGLQAGKVRIIIFATYGSNDFLERHTVYFSQADGVVQEIRNGVLGHRLHYKRN